MKACIELGLRYVGEKKNSISIPIYYSRMAHAEIVTRAMFEDKELVST